MSEYNSIPPQPRNLMLDSRDPTELDKGYFPFWLNLYNNRIFRYMGYENGKHFWDHLKEYEDDYNNNL